MFPSASPKYPLIPPILTLSYIKEDFLTVCIISTFLIVSTPSPSPAFSRSLTYPLRLSKILHDSLLPVHFSTYSRG